MSESSGNFITDLFTTSIIQGGYKNTVLFYTNIVLNVIFILKEPIMMLGAYTLFNNWNIITILYFSVEFALAVYILFLMIADQLIQ